MDMREDRLERFLRSRAGKAVLVACVLTLAAGLRLWGIGWGLPDHTHLFSYHPDEFHSLRGAISLAGGDPNPHFFNYGSLYLYAVAVACLWHDATFGGADLPGALLKGDAAHDEMAAWVLDARLVTVVCAVLTVLVVFMLGRRLFGMLGGLFAGGVMAILPLHVLNSHYATVDVPQALFITLCLYFSVRIIEEPGLRNSVLAGMAAGLAAGVKYNGALAIAAPMVALAVCALGKDREEAGRIGWLAPAGMIGAAVLAFAATSPYVLLAWPEAWEHIRFELAHMRVGESPVKEAHPNGWLFHAHISLALGALSLLLARGELRRKLAPAAVFGALWFVMIGAAGVRYARYEIPLEPLTAVFFAGVYMSVLRRSYGRWWQGIGLAVACAWLTLLCATVEHRDSAMAQENVRDAMLRDVLALVPPDETLGLAWAPWFNVAAVDYCNGGEALRSNPVFARFKRPVRALVVCGMDAERIKDERPYAVLVSDFELEPGFAAVSPAHRRVADLLWRGGEYELVAQHEREYSARQCVLRGRGADSRYAAPNLYLFVREDGS